MKNLYIYGASDDLHEVESDFGVRDEFSSDADLNGVTIHWEYNGDWKITLSGNFPPNWKIKKISGTSDFYHIQIPDDDKVRLSQSAGDIDDDDRPGYLMDYIETWCDDQNIDNIDSFYEHFQSDNFPEEMGVFVENVLKLANRFSNK